MAPFVALFAPSRSNGTGFAATPVAFAFGHERRLEETMPPIDPGRVGKLVGAMRESVALLREIAGMPEGEFMRDKHLQGSAKYNFIAAIEVAVCCASRLVSKSGFRSPEDYADAFAVLAEHGVLEPDFAKELQNMARFRNRLVHIFWDTDTSEIWAILRSRLDAFERCRQALAGHLTS